MTSKHTADSLAALIAANVEPPTAEAVLTALREIDGQPITTRILDHFPGGRVEWRLGRLLGHTEVRNRAYITSQGSSPESVNLVLARSEVVVPLEVAWIERENPAYFAGRRSRNALRAQALADTGMLTSLAAVMNEIEDVNAALALAKPKFAAFVGHGMPCSADRYLLEGACGLREEKQ